MIVALVGRRIDAESTSIPRFPFDSIARVREEIRAFFTNQLVKAVVGSGACGADLLAFDIAGQLGIPRYMLLPFAKEDFRKVKLSPSVTKRTGLQNRTCSFRQHPAPRYNGLCHRYLYSVVALCEPS